jgi:hypothetical protein
MSLLDKLFKLLIIVFLFSSCRTITGPYRLDYATQYQRDNFYKYQSVYNQANDTVKAWINDTLEIGALYVLTQYQIDSAFVFNKDSTRLYSTINTKETVFKTSKMEGATEFFGAKVRGHWYFVLGGGLAIPKNWYQDSLYAPMTLAEISYVAHTNFIQSRLLKKADGSYESNDAIISLNLIAYGCLACTTKVSYDSLFLVQWREGRKKKFNWAEMEKIKLEASKIPQPAEPTQHRNILKRIFIPFRPKVFGRRRENDPWK